MQSATNSVSIWVHAAPNGVLPRLAIPQWLGKNPEFRVFGVNYLPVQHGKKLEIRISAPTTNKAQRAAVKLCNLLRESKFSITIESSPASRTAPYRLLKYLRANCDSTIRSARQLAEETGLPVHDVMFMLEALNELNYVQRVGSRLVRLNSDTPLFSLTAVGRRFSPRFEQIWRYLGTLSTGSRVSAGEVAKVIGSNREHTAKQLRRMVKLGLADLHRTKHESGRYRHKYTLTETSRQEARHSGSQNTASVTGLERVLDYVHSQTPNPVTIKDVSESTGLSVARSHELLRLSVAEGRLVLFANAKTGPERARNYYGTDNALLPPTIQLSPGQARTLTIMASFKGPVTVATLTQTGVPDGSVYQDLSRLKDLGYIRPSRRRTRSSGRPRQLYEITKQGREAVPLQPPVRRVDPTEKSLLECLQNHDVLVTLKLIRDELGISEHLATKLTRSLIDRGCVRKKGRFQHDSSNGRDVFCITPRGEELLRELIFETLDGHTRVLLTLLHFKNEQISVVDVARRSLLSRGFATRELNELANKEYVQRSTRYDNHNVPNYLFRLTETGQQYAESLNTL